MHIRVCVCLRACVCMCMCVFTLCRQRDKRQPRHSNHAQSSQINTALSLETNIGPSHFWTCSSTSLIQVHFFFSQSFLHTHTQSPPPQLHASTENCHSRQHFVPVLELWDSVKEKGCGNEHQHNNVSVWFVCSQSQPLIHSLREDSWIIKGLSGMLEEVSNWGLNYCSPY